MSIDEFRHALGYTSQKSTAAERRRARKLANRIITENRELLGKLAQL